jgi:hypothetical protein
MTHPVNKLQIHWIVSLNFCLYRMTGVIAAPTVRCVNYYRARDRDPVGRHGWFWASEPLNSGTARREPGSYRPECSIPTFQAANTEYRSRMLLDADMQPIGSYGHWRFGRFISFDEFTNQILCEDSRLKG